MPRKQKKTALLYYRVSTASQAERGQGLDVQRKLCRDYCKKTNILVQDEFSDEGVSGTTIEREGIQDLLAALNGADFVVVANTSRLWRDDWVRALIQRELKRAGKDVRSVDNPKYSLYSELPEDFLISAMMEALDSYERLATVLKLKRARRMKASKGNKPAGSAPHGYKWVEERSNGRREKTIGIDANEGETVKRIFREYLQRKSVGKVAKHLAEEGILNRRGKPFSRAGLHIILTNDFYVGRVRHGAVDTEGKHEPLVNRITFGKVQKALERNRRRT